MAMATSQSWLVNNKFKINKIGSKRLKAEGKLEWGVINNKNNKM